jgi:anti-sigma28 factor (negative regulator of flagellin synthesis)
MEKKTPLGHQGKTTLRPPVHATEARELKVARVRDEISSGTYHVDAEEIAEKMIVDGVIDELL